MEAVNMIKPTSKAALKSQCLYLCRMDIDKAEKMYDFLVKGMDNLPDVEPETKTFIQNFGDQAKSIFGWLRENEDMLAKGTSLIRGIISKRSGVPAAPLPPINE